MPTVFYSEAVDQAICFGWIDSKINKRDGQSYFQYFAKRNPKSNWSRINKEKFAHLQAQGLIAPAGLACIELAKKSGTWNVLDKAENLELPKMMEDLIATNELAKTNWNNFSRSAKRAILEWIYNAKQPLTQQNRMKKQ